MTGDMPDPADGGEGEPYDAAERRVGAAHAAALRAQAAAGGLRFEAYLPPDLALWLLDQIATGVFKDPSEAVFVMLGEQQDMEPHADLRRELLSRTLQAAMKDPRPGIPAEEMFRKLKALGEKPLPEPAVWKKLS